MKPTLQNSKKISFEETLKVVKQLQKKREKLELQNSEEKWVDIIREWQTESYPPIRPLAKRIVMEIQRVRQEERYKFLKIIGIDEPEVFYKTEVEYGTNDAKLDGRNELRQQQRTALSKEMKI